jgi:hypothetical protein
MKLATSLLTFAYLARSELVHLKIAGVFKLGPVHLKLSFKLDPSIILLYSTPSTFLLHLSSANHFFKIVIVTVARVLN